MHKCNNCGREFKYKRVFLRHSERCGAEIVKNTGFAALKEAIRDCAEAAERAEGILLNIGDAIPRVEIERLLEKEGGGDGQG